MNRMVARLKVLLIWFWRLISRPSAYLSLGFLTLGGFVFGVLFWGALEVFAIVSMIGRHNEPDRLFFDFL
jgi:hypothetical protein